MKTVIITGSTGGIGAALVTAFIHSNYRVIGVDLNRPPGNNQQYFHVTADLDRMVASPDYREEVVSKLRIKIGSSGLAALINNAAIQRVGPFETLTYEDWIATLNVNVLAPVALVRAFLPELSATRGTVMNIASVHSKLTKPHFTAYATSKAGLVGLTSALAVELGDRIQVMGACPAAVETPLLHQGFAGDTNAYYRLRDFHPSRSIGTPEDLAFLLKTLIDTAGPFHNGMIINFDGGISARLHDPS